MKRSRWTCVLAGMGLCLGWGVALSAQGPAGPASAAGAASATGAAAAATFEYEVASIKPHDKGEQGWRWRMQEDGLEMIGPGVAEMIRNAYGLDPMEDVKGLPPELKNANWDVRAKSDADTAAALKKMSPEERGAAIRGMMLRLLEQRFGLKAHVETHEAPIYALVLAKGGTKLQPVDADKPRTDGMKGPDGTIKNGFLMFGQGDVKGQGIGIKPLLQVLQRQVDRKVVDRTGLTGVYDFELKFSTNATGEKQAAVDENLPSLFTALEEQMGLRLESARGPVRSVVVDHIEMPSEN